MARPPVLSRDRIVAATLKSGEENGPAGTTMRRIAAELNCDPMAIYRYFGNREELFDFVADEVLEAVAEPSPDLRWQERVSDIQRGIREVALAHPAVTAHLAARPSLGRNGQRLAVAMLDALKDAGLDEVTSLRAFQTLVAYLSASLAMTVRTAGERDDRWRHVSAMFSILPGGPPGDALFNVGSAEQFEFGLRLLLNGIQLESRPG